MRLVLAIPASAERRELDPDTSLVILEGPAEKPVATLTLFHPRISRMAVMEFSTDTARHDLPAGTISDIQRASVDRNRTGWEMQVVQTSVWRSDTLVTVETRLTAIFLFASHQPFVAAALARIFEPSRFEELRPRIDELFETARPDWTGLEPACLAQTYD